MDSQNTLWLESITNAGSPHHKSAGKDSLSIDAALIPARRVGALRCYLGWGAPFRGNSGGNSPIAANVLVLREPLPPSLRYSP